MPVGKKKCPECDAELGVRKQVCDCGHVFVFKQKEQESKPPKPKKKKAPPKINKRDVLLRFVEEPFNNKRQFFARESVLLKKLCDKYSLEFMSIVSFPKKFESMTYLFSDYYKNQLEIKWRAFNYKVDKKLYPTYNIGEKIGEDKIITKKKKTTKDFLNE